MARRDTRIFQIPVVEFEALLIMFDITHTGLLCGLLVALLHSVGSTTGATFVFHTSYLVKTFKQSYIVIELVERTRK